MQPQVVWRQRHFKFPFILPLIGPKPQGGDSQSFVELQGTTSGDFADSNSYDLGEPIIVSHCAWGAGMRAPPNTEASLLDIEDVSWMWPDLGNSADNPNKAGPSEVGAGGSTKVGSGGDRYVPGVDGAWYNDIGTRYGRIEPMDSGTEPTYEEAALLELEDANYAIHLATGCRRRH